MGEWKFITEAAVAMHQVLSDGAETITPSSASNDDRRLSLGADESSHDEDDDRSLAQDALSRVGAIIGRATYEYDCTSEGQDSQDDDGEVQEAIAARAAYELVEPVTGAVLGKSRRAPAPPTFLMGTGGVPNKARGADIAKILKALPEPCRIQRYAERIGFGRMPGYLREVREHLDAEQQHIISLHESRDDLGNKAMVRLLAQGEKDELLQGLKLKLMQASNRALKAKPRSKARSEIEAELERIRKDIANLSNPYIFVEVST